MIVDASAIIAVMRDEPGAEQAAILMEGSFICSVNVSEIAGHLARLGADRAGIDAAVLETGLTVIDADTDLAIEAGLLRPFTDPAGLSMGDRFCLALAKRLDQEALTADRDWVRIAEVIGVKVRLIR